MLGYETSNILIKENFKIKGGKGSLQLCHKLSKHSPEVLQFCHQNVKTL